MLCSLWELLSKDVEVISIAEVEQRSFSKNVTRLRYVEKFFSMRRDVSLSLGRRSSWVTWIVRWYKLHPCWYELILMKTLVRISSEILQFTLLIRHTLFRISNLIDDSLQYKCFKAKRGTSKHFYPILILIHTSFIITVQEMRQKTDQSRVPCSFVSHRFKHRSAISR